MAIKAVKNIKHNGKYFEKDALLPKMNKADEQRLIDLGVAISLESKEEKDKKNESKAE